MISYTKSCQSTNPTNHGSDNVRGIRRLSRQTLTVLIVTLNEEENLPRTLEAVKWTDEFVIVDRFSTDRTPEIARSYPQTVFIQNDDWMNVNANLGMERSKSDWILQLDADEVVSPELAVEIQRLLQSPDVQFDGFRIPHRTWYFGKWIRYGPAYDPRSAPGRAGFGYRERLFRKGFAWYECRGVHEGLAYKGRWGTLEGHYEHYSHPTISRWIAKMNHYTDIDVGNLDVTAPGFRLPRRGRTLLWFCRIFFDLYVKRKGYKDGTHGFIVCALHTLYPFIERCKTWEKHYQRMKDEG